MFIRESRVVWTYLGILQFRHSKKATKFGKINIVKTKWEIFFQIFVAFSEYLLKESKNQLKSIFIINRKGQKSLIGTGTVILGKI